MKPIRLPLVFAPGVNSDDTAFSQEMRVTAGDNVRWVNDDIQPIGGWTKYAGGQMTGVCRNVLAWNNLAGSLLIAFGTHSKLYVLKNGTFYDITPSGLAAGAEHGAGGPGFGAGDYGEGTWGGGGSSEYYPRTWSLATWGENLLASPRGGTLYEWGGNTGSLATVVTNAPDNITAMLVTGERQVLALGCNEEVSTTFNSRCIRGCDIEDYTNWTTTATNNAFEHILEGSGGNIVTGRIFGSVVATWTDKEVYVGEYRGLPEQTYRFDLQASNCGTCGPNSPVVFNNTARWITPDFQFYEWSLGSAPVPIACTKRDDFKDHVAAGQSDKIVGTVVGKYAEIWWHYPDSRDGNECSRYISLGTMVPYGQPYWWSGGTLARSAATDSGPTRHPIMVSADSYAYSHEDGQDANGGALEWSFTVALPQIDNGGRFVILDGIEPDIKDQVGAVTMTVTLKKYPQSPTPTGTKTVTLAPGAIRKDFMAQGRSGIVTFSGNSAPTYGRFGKPVLTGKPTGQQ